MTKDEEADLIIERLSMTREERRHKRVTEFLKRLDEIGLCREVITIKEKHDD